MTHANETKEVLALLSFEQKVDFAVMVVIQSLTENGMTEKDFARFKNTTTFEKMVADLLKTFA